MQRFMPQIVAWWLEIVEQHTFSLSAFSPVSIMNQSKISAQDVRTVRCLAVDTLEKSPLWRQTLWRCTNQRFHNKVQQKQRRCGNKIEWGPFVEWYKGQVSHRCWWWIFIHWITYWVTDNIHTPMSWGTQCLEEQVGAKTACQGVSTERMDGFTWSLRCPHAESNSVTLRPS